MRISDWSADVCSSDLPGFNLHLRDGDITEAWVVRKPTRDGIATALEVYDAEGRQIAQMFGERHDGEKELADWRTLIETLAPEGAAGQLVSSSLRLWRSPSFSLPPFGGGQSPAAAPTRSEGRGP